MNTTATSVVENQIRYPMPKLGIEIYPIEYNNLWNYIDNVKRKEVT